MKLISQIQDKMKRHQERNQSLGYRYVIADSIQFLDTEVWKKLVKNGSIFLDQKYLQAIESAPPSNTSQRYAIAYDGDKPIVALVCQIADVCGESITKPTQELSKKMAQNYRERILVCGNLVSSGLHGIAFDESLDIELVWRIAAEILYKIRCSERLDGPIDFVMLKDMKGEYLNVSSLLERYSYRKIKTDPDMVLVFAEAVKTFDDYLVMLTSKYRNRVRKVIKQVEKAGLQCQKLCITPELDKQLHQLYLQVENRASTRLATLPEGYFYTLAQQLGEKFCCYGITRDNEVVGFISMVKDGDTAVAYYVGFNYEINQQVPIYFRLLQLVIQWGAEQNCRQISFGRTAAEPKVNLGAKPVDTYIWVRHRVPLVNFFVRKLFPNIPYKEVPQRSVLKSS